MPALRIERLPDMGSCEGFITSCQEGDTIYAHRAVFPVARVKFTLHGVTHYWTRDEALEVAAAIQACAQDG